MSASSQQKKVALITGVSEGGIGHQLALTLLRRGYRVYGTLRTPGKEGALSQQADYRTLMMNVDSSETIRNAKEEFLKHESRLDLIICNAGYGGNHILMDLSERDAQAMLSTNVMGVLLTSQIFGGILTAQGSGTIVIVGSLVGFITFPWQGMYHVTKAAVRSLSAQLRCELEPLGVKVLHLAPGLVGTPFATKINWPDENNSPSYRLYEKSGLEQSFNAVKAAANTSGKEAMPVSKFAEAAVTWMDSASPAPELLLGTSAGLISWVQPYTPTSIWDFVIKQMTKLGQVKRADGK